MMGRGRNGAHIARRQAGLKPRLRPSALLDTQIIDNGKPSCRLTSDAKRISQVPIAKDESSQDDAPFFDGNRDMSVIQVGIRAQGVRYTLPDRFGIRRGYGGIRRRYRSGREVNRSLLLLLRRIPGLRRPQKCA